jgi:lipopolysaccharide export system protein LptA
MALRTVLLLTTTVLLNAMAAQTGTTREGTRVEILNADEWSFDNALAPGAQRLRGNVRFKHADAIMECDSAYLYQDQRVDAFGNIHIRQGDTLHIQGNKLLYNGVERRARIEGDVRLQDPDMELTTPSLDYELRDKRARYTEGGTIISRKENNVLSSRAGSYFSDSRTLHFSRDVRLDHPERTISTDTMHYATASGIASFFGPTTIRQIADSTEIRTSRGTYDTRREEARSTRRSSIRTKGRLLESDTLHYDRNTGIGLAWGHVSMTDTSGELIVRGDHGRYSQDQERSLITGHAELVLLMDSDSLFLHGDTLFTRPDESADPKVSPTGRRVITAYRNVRFYKSDMQGVCDTLVYSDADSLLQMFDRPALWSGNDQITGEHISILMRNGAPHQLNVERNAFLMSLADTSRFDQVTGTTMTGFFRDGELHRILAEGNARTVYFAREMKDGKEELMGMNRADCSRIAVGLADGRVNTVTFMDRPDAVLYPMDKVPPDELRMKGSEWRSDERPMDRSQIFGNYR